MPDSRPAREAQVREAEAGGAAELIALIDRLEGVLERSGLGELEVGAGETTLVLRSRAALAAVAEPDADAGASLIPAPPGAADAAAGESLPRAVVAPLTGIYYASPAPDAAPYVRIGTEVVVGQVIGLIEAMKLFNEIKSDVAGRVVRMVAESGTLVKARQALIEVEPL